MSQEIIIKKLDEILEIELSGVTRYLHYSLMITGPNRIPIVKYFRDLAMESFQHAASLGEKITALGGHPSVKTRPVPETHKHGVLDILQESLEFERHALELYVGLLPLCEGNIALEEMLRTRIREEQEHIEEAAKMIKTS